VVLGYGVKRVADMHRYLNPHISVNELSDYFSPEFKFKSGG
jgi:hypothetical protein